MRLDEYEFCMLEDIAIPPYSNTGVTNPKNTQKYLVKYDWFEGLITWDGVEYYDVIADIIKGLGIGYDGFHDTKTQGQYLPNGKRVAKARNWQHAMVFLSGQIPLMTVSYGGPNSQYGDYFSITGESAHLIVDSLKRFFSNLSSGSLTNNQLSVKRVDVAIDVRGDFDFMVGKMMPVIDKHGLEISNQGNWLTPSNKGRTLYLRKSQTVEMRVYEKGHQMREVFGIEDSPVDWVRFELQIRVPKGKQNKLMKKALAAATASEIFHSFEFAVDCFASVTGLDLDYTPIKYTQKPEPLPIEKLLQVIATQYGDKLTALLDTPDGFNMLMESLYPNSDDIPSYIRSTAFDYIEKQAYLRHGEY